MECSLRQSQFSRGSTPLTSNLNGDIDREIWEWQEISNNVQDIRSTERLVKHLSVQVKGNRVDIVGCVFWNADAVLALAPDPGKVGVAAVEVVFGGVAECYVHVIEGVLPCCLRNGCLKCFSILGKSHVVYAGAIRPCICTDVYDLPVYRTLALCVATLMRRDDQASTVMVAGSPCVTSRRGIDKVQLDSIFPALDTFQMVFMLFQVEHWVLPTNLDLRSKGRCITPDILICPLSASHVPRQTK